MKKALLLIPLLFFCAVSAASSADLASRKLTRYLNLACGFKDICRYDMASQVLASARKQFPADRDCILLSARVYYLNNRPQKAVTTLQDLLTRDPNDKEALLLAGLSQVDLGNDEKAQGYLRRVIDEDSANVIARLSLADIYYRCRKLDESAAQFKAVNLIDASIQNIHLLWAQILDSLGDIKGAFKLVEKVTLAQPANVAAQTMLEKVRKKLGEGFFAAERDKKVAARKEKLIFVKPFPRIDKMAFVRIGLHQGQPRVQFLCSKPFDIKDKSGKVLFADLAAAHAFMVIRGKDGKPILMDEQSFGFSLPNEVTIAPRDPAATITLFDITAGKENFWAHTREAAYRGEMAVRSLDDGFQTINVLSLEEYLYSVVPSEMPAYWPLEALKAQAVAARSESMAKLGRHKKEGFDFCDDVHCQMYKGVENEARAATVAVDDTRGQVLKYKGKYVDAVYSSCCSGHTQGNIFGDTEDIPYLQGAADMQKPDLRFPLSRWALEGWLKEPPAGIYCRIDQGALASAFRWVRIYSAQELDALFAADGIGRVRKIIALGRSDSGHISRLKIVGDKESRILEKELVIRRALGNLRSSLFNVEVKFGPDQQPSQFVFYGGGWGHGVGMCQTGARGMAQAGKDFRQILQHYFHNTELTQLYR